MRYDQHLTKDNQLKRLFDFSLKEGLNKSKSDYFKLLETSSMSDTRPLQSS